MKAITVRQPWAWATMNAGKDVENRTWSTHFRGTVAIHAALRMTRDDYDNGCEYVKSINSRIKTLAYEDLALRMTRDDYDNGCEYVKSINSRIKTLAYEDLVRGAIIGTIRIVDCVNDSESPWFGGEYGFVIAQPKNCQHRNLQGSVELLECTEKHRD